MVAAEELLMHGTQKVRVYEELQRMGRKAAEDRGKAEQARDHTATYDNNELCALLSSLSPFCSLEKSWTGRQWNEFEKMVVEAAHFPYKLYRPLMKSNLIIILSALPST